MKSKFLLLISLLLVFSTACQTEVIVEEVEEIVETEALTEPIEGVSEELNELVEEEEEQNAILQWTNGEELDADLDSFEVLYGNYFAKDKDHVYLNDLNNPGVVILEADPSEVEFINEFLFVDSNGMFGPHVSNQEDAEIVWDYIDFVDVDSFEFVNGSIAIDKDDVLHVYGPFYHFPPYVRILEDLDVETIEISELNTSEVSNGTYFLHDSDSLIFVDGDIVSTVITEDFILEDWKLVSHEGGAGLWTYQGRIFVENWNFHVVMIDEFTELDYESLEVIDEYTIKDKNAVYSRLVDGGYYDDYEDGIWHVVEVLDLDLSYQNYEDEYIQFQYPEGFVTSGLTSFDYSNIGREKSGEEPLEDDGKSYPWKDFGIDGALLSYDVSFLMTSNQEGLAMSDQFVYNQNTNTLSKYEEENGEEIILGTDLDIEVHKIEGSDFYIIVFPKEIMGQTFFMSHLVENGVYIGRDEDSDETNKLIYKYVDSGTDYPSLVFMFTCEDLKVMGQCIEILQTFYSTYTELQGPSIFNVEAIEPHVQWEGFLESL